MRNAILVSVMHLAQTRSDEDSDKCVGRCGVAVILASPANDGTD